MRIPFHTPLGPEVERGIGAGRVSPGCAACKSASGLRYGVVFDKNKFLFFYSPLVYHNEGAVA